uniref:RNA-directed DNA polymerase n=1 Tax=Quercus lobata TaxID=97700 RepID=A0A7N2N597_QUELO
MASSKNVRKSVVDDSSADEYVGPITRSRSKALDRLQPQPTQESQPPAVTSLDFLANRKATTKDLPASKDLETSNESSPTKTFSINSSPVMRNLRSEVPLTHPVSSFSPSSIEVMPVMMTNTSTMEEKMAEMEQRVILLTKALEEKDVKIATLMNKLEVQDSGESSLGPEQPPGFTFKGENAKGDKGKGAQYGGSSTSSLLYSKPYTKRIDNMRMPNGYQPPKFLQFDGKGNPKQHIAHFVETCENAGTQGGLFVKKFVRSLKGNAFDWYTDLEPESIDSWEQLEREFLNRFYSTRRTDSTAHDAHHGNTKPPVPEERKERREIRKNDRNAKSNIKDSMNVNPAPIKISTKNVKANEKRPEGGQQRETRRSSLKEWEQKVYPFLDADMPEMLEQLLKLKLIELSECKRPEEMRKVDDPNYCRYHRIISHPIQKCFVLKELIMKLAKERKIDLDFNDVAQSNLVTFSCGLPSSLSPNTKQGANTTLIHFGSLEPVQVQLSQKAPHYNSNDDKRSTTDEEEVEAVHTISRCEIQDEKEDVDHDDPKETLSSLEELQSQVDEVEPLQSSTSPKEVLTRALEAPEIYAPHTNTLQQTQGCYACSPDLTFTDEDLLLGSKPHNRPLYVSGYAREQRIECILVDGGSAVNILPKMTMKRLGFTMEELSHSRLVIQGFNQGGQRAIGLIHLELSIGELKSNVLFHVIDAKTTYNMLLGRPWIHENGIVPSTLHQCFKFFQNGIKKVDADLKPFAETEAHFADAKFYAKEDISSEVLPVEIPSMKSKQDEKEHVKFIAKKDISSPKKGPEPFLRYIPLSHRKNGQSPFAECLQPTKDMGRPAKLTMEDVAILKEDHVMPLTSSTNPLPSKPLNGFVRSLQTPIEHGILPSGRTKEWFDPKAYRLLAKAGYDFSKREDLGKLIPEATGEKMHGLSKTQRKMRLEGHEIHIPKTGLGYTPEQPAQIWIKKRSDPSSSQYITVEVGESSNQRKDHSSPHVSVFDRIEASSSRITVFDRLNTTCLTPNRDTLACKSVFDRLGATKRPIDSHSQSSINFDVQGEKKANDEIRSSIPSRMKRNFTLEINTQGSLKVKRRTIVHTSQSPVHDEEIEEVSSSFHITIEESTLSDAEATNEEVDEAPPALEDGGQATVDELKEINLGTVEEPRPTFISALLTPEEEEGYLKLLVEYKDVFAWTYKEMPGLNPSIALHHLAVKKGVRPVKQAQRRFRPELIPQIETEVNKLIEAGFIREVQYPEWIANIVPVKKKNGQIRVCVDFRDLNNACPKDDFPLPITEVMVDATTGHEALSFMDGSSGYNQIRMNPKDEQLTAFRTPKGIYCYKVMPFGLKNAGATYQRAMQKIFDNVLHKYVECYVDDLVVKTKRREDHLADLRSVFTRLRKYQLKMNPRKCAFGVTSGKFLGFIVRHRGIEIDQSKIEAIQKMPEPKNLRELRGLQGKLAYIRRFISNLAGRCQPFNRLMKKDVHFEWDEACSNAFALIKRYLLNPPVLGAPIPGKPLVLYIAAQERSLGALMAQENKEGKERALYYLSRTLNGAELNYSPIEKMCLALFFAIDKLEHYMQAYTVRLIAKADPIKYVLSRPVVSGRIARWAVLLQQYDLAYIPQKAVKGQALADFLADHPVPSDWEFSDDFPDEDVFYIEEMPSWIMFFDGVARQEGAGAGVVFVSPQRQILLYSFSLSELCSNNVAEYQALIIGLQMAIEMGIAQLEIFGDSKLIINQILEQYDVKKEDLIPYCKYAKKLLANFEATTLEHIPRKENRQADALANLATALALSQEETTKVAISQRWVIPLVVEEEEEEQANIISVCLVEKEDWRQVIIEYLQHGRLPDDKRHKTEIRRRAARFIYYKDTLFRRSFDGLFLRCLGEEEAKQALEEAHSGICGAHQSGPKLHYRIKRMGYYWPTMVQDSMECAKKCEACQYHANFIHQPPEPLHPTVASWPFDAWGLDAIGPLPKSSGGHLLMTELCEKFEFKQYNSSMYNASANGLAEAFNKTLGSLLKKVVSKTKRDWHERIGEALWAYRTTFRTPTQATPYSLVYGVEAVLPLERQIPSLRIAIQEGLTGEENAKLRLQELEALDEKRLEAQQRLECYQARLSSAFNKRVKPRSFQVGDLVLAVRRPIITTHRTSNKFTSKWDGPSVVQEVYTNGAYKLIDNDGVRIGPINGKFLKRFYA